MFSFTQVSSSLHQKQIGSTRGNREQFVSNQVFIETPEKYTITKTEIRDLNRKPSNGLRESAE